MAEHRRDLRLAGALAGLDWASSTLTWSAHQLRGIGYPGLTGVRDELRAMVGRPQELEAVVRKAIERN